MGLLVFVEAESQISTCLQILSLLMLKKNSVDENVTVYVLEFNLAFCVCFFFSFFKFKENQSITCGSGNTFQLREVQILLENSNFPA